MVSSLLKNAKNRLLTRAARNRRRISSNACRPATEPSHRASIEPSHRTATARERSARTLFQQLVRPLIAATGCLGLSVIAVSLLYPQQTPPQSPAIASVTTPRAVIDKYCIGCHNATMKTAGL